MGVRALKSHAGGAKYELKSNQDSVIPFSIIIAFVIVCASITRAHTSDRYNAISLLDLNHFVLGYVQWKLVYKYIGVYTKK